MELGRWEPEIYQETTIEGGISPGLLQKEMAEGTSHGVTLWLPHQEDSGNQAHSNLSEAIEKQSMRTPRLKEDPYLEHEAFNTSVFSSSGNSWYVCLHHYWRKASVIRYISVCTYPRNTHSWAKTRIPTTTKYTLGNGELIEQLDQHIKISTIKILKDV